MSDEVTAIQDVFDTITMVPTEAATGLLTESSLRI